MKATIGVWIFGNDLQWSANCPSKEGRLDIGLIEIHPESKNCVFSLSLFSIPVVCEFKFVGNRFRYCESN